MRELHKASVIIPSAKIVPEGLQKLGKLPGVIYPINQRIVFDYLFDQYSACQSINIICYENSELVKRRLNKYKGANIKITTLSKLNDLGYTIYSGLCNVEGQIIINFADTIVMDDIDSCDGDSYFCQEDFVSDEWTYFDECEGVITNVYDKKIMDTTGKKRLFVGVFKLIDANYFKRCLEFAFSNHDKSISSYYLALMEYSKRHPMKAIDTQNWFDIGHEDKYYNSKLEVRAREFNHISIDKNRGILRKSSDDKDKFIGEIKWYLKLPSDIEYARPRIFSYSTSYEDPYVSMEYYAYHTVHELFLFGDLTYQQWNDIFNRIRFVCNDFKRYTVCDKRITESLEDMYLSKTLQRFEMIRKDDRFSVFFDHVITVNDFCYLSLNKVIEKLKVCIPSMLYDIKAFNIIHGDLCFSNIMIDSNFSFIKIVDPRGKFGAFDIYGDFRYELAKLLHSVDAKYDFIITDQFDASYDLVSARINYTIQDRRREFDLYRIFLESFSYEIGNDLKKIELIESLLFFSMIPLHNENFNHQLVMLGRGLEILNRVIDITAEEG